MIKSHEMPRRSFLSDFELVVLLAVLRVGDSAYGVPVAREIEARTGRTVDIAVVYGTLSRLEGKGLVSSALGDPTAARGGRAKRFFRVTGQGVREARQAQRALVAMWRGVPQLDGGAV
jgi:PadR family transcriptional regulator, regulatory protein PadR